MSQELKYKVGDRVRVVGGDLHNGKVGVVDEIDLGDTYLPYLIEFGEDSDWLREAVLTRAASSPDEQDIENAGGSEFVPSFFVGDKVRHKDQAFIGVGVVEEVDPNLNGFGPYRVRTQVNGLIYCLGENLELAQPEQATTEAGGSDPVNHPSHYTSDPSGVECIEITRHRNFNVGSAIKYLWRAGLKDQNPTTQDLEKAIWYIRDEIARIDARNSR